MIGEGKFTRYRDVEAELIGKTVEEVQAHIDDYVRLFIDRMTFTRGRVSAEYRKTVIGNLIRDYLMTL